MARPCGGLSLLLALPAPGRLAFAAALLARLRAEPALARAALRVAVGPEGGFLEDEERAFGRAGFTPAHLGERRLRFETAAVAALCHVRALWALEGEAWTS
jgi:16S rRNA (uracil1498-N3)-methyltransferase